MMRCHLIRRIQHWELRAGVLILALAPSFGRSYKADILSSVCFYETQKFAVDIATKRHTLRAKIVLLLYFLYKNWVSTISLYMRDSEDLFQMMLMQSTETQGH